MEPKQVKKLVINQEVISNLNDTKMSKIKGGGCTGGPGSDVLCSHYPCTEQTPGSDACPKPVKTYVNCPDTNILEGTCATWDQEICRWSDYHCETDYACPF